MVDDNSAHIAMTTARKWIVVLVVIVAAAAALSFTKPGYRVLNNLGIATADCEGDCR